MGHNKQSFQIDGIMEKGYGFIPKLIMKDKELTIEAKAIYAYLSSYTGAGNTAYPSISLMCGDLGISEARFYKHRKLLVEKGYVVITKQRSKGGWDNNIYTLPFKPYPQNLSTQNLSTQNLSTQNLSTQNVGTKSNSIKSNSIKSNSIKIKEPSKTSKKFHEDTIEYQLSELLYKKILSNDDKTKKPNLYKWAEHIDKLIRIDRRSEEDIRKVIEFATNNSFWMTNILSTNKLRKQFQTLFLQAKEDKLSGTDNRNYRDAKAKSGKGEEIDWAERAGVISL